MNPTKWEGWDVVNEPVSGQGLGGKRIVNTRTERDVAAIQRELLERLIVLTDEGERALNAGDMAGLAYASTRRGEVIGAAAAHVPPHTPWAPEVEDLAARAYERSETLQQAIRSCLVLLRRDLAALTGRERVAHYLKGEASGQRSAQWKA